MQQSKAINMIANTLLSLGWNKTSIIGLMNNMSAESSFDPKITEYGRKPIFSSSYAFGVGLVQFSYPPLNEKIYIYNKTHSDEESIKYQCSIITTSRPLQSWLNTTGGQFADEFDNYTIDEFIHNSRKLTWQQQTAAWFNHFERGVDTISNRIANYSVWYKHVSWSSDNPSTEQPSSYTKNKLLTVNGCLSFFNQTRKNWGSSDGQGGNNDRPPAEPSDRNIQAVLKLFNECQAAGTIYSQTRRSRILTDKAYSDCSAFVSQCVAKYLSINDNTLCNTETLHAWVRKYGYSLVWNTSVRNRTPPNYKQGDVIIIGRIGTSLGDYGHTLFIIDDKGTTIECTSSTPSVVKSTLAARLSNYALWWGSNYHVYQYRI